MGNQRDTRSVVFNPWRHSPKSWYGEVSQMELFGIVLSIPGAFIASAVYRSLLMLAVRRWPLIRPVFKVASYIVLTGIIAEWMFLALRGAVGTRVAVGPLYFVAHVSIFFLGTPALMNLLALSNPSKWYARWWLSVPLCTVLAFVLVLQQYVVSEALYGIEGTDGPFSQIDHMHN
jgi:hypothetical protein